MIISSQAKAAEQDTSNSTLLNLTILGAIASLGYACYEGKNPCRPVPTLDTEQLTFTADIGSDNTIQHQRLALGADWADTLLDSENFQIDGRWEINLNLWNSTKKNPLNKSGYIIGVTPVFHYKVKTGNIKPYFELGGGPQLLSDAIIENENKSTQFQFGSVLGFGIEHKSFELGYRYLHISNANIEIPNPGTDFHNLHLAYKF